MKGSLITKKKIAKEFKQLVATIGFEKVSISKIMQAADMRRQTYYDHFQDKYELVDWIFQQEAMEKIQDNLEYEGWEIILEDLFEYFEENQIFYRNLLAFEGQNSFQTYYLQHFKVLIHQMLELTNQGDLSQADFVFLEDFYANGFVSMTYNWLVNECQPDAYTFSRQMKLAFLASFAGKK